MAVSDSENEREYRVLDQMLTMHCLLCDGYRRAALAVQCALLVSSVVLGAFVFAGDEMFQLLSWNPANAKLILGACSVIILGLSVVELRVNWQGKAESHRRASERLSCLKAKYRRSYGLPGKS